MTLESTISDVVSRLRQGLFPNEQAISQGIVLRFLQQLGWESWDTTVVWPEYQTGEGRADFALCHPPSKPTIFIEVKSPGKAEDGVRQALDYAFHSGGVPVVVLTDGKTWSFYLTMEQGSYEDRRVFKLDLFEREPSAASAALHRYLERTRVISGAALDVARGEYRSRNRQAQAKAAIPDAWKELVGKGDELLVELLTNAVESKAGVRPDVDDVTGFLLSLIGPSGKGVGAQPTPNVTLPQTLTPSPVIVSGMIGGNVPETTRSGTLILKGKSYRYATAKEAMVTVLRELATADPTFLQRCAQHPEIQGRQRRYIGRTAAEMYPHREDLREYVEPLPGGWFVSTNLNNPTKNKVIRVAAEVAGLKFGQDLKVDF